MIKNKIFFLSALLISSAVMFGMDEDRDLTPESSLVESNLTLSFMNANPSQEEGSALPPKLTGVKILAFKHDRNEPFNGHITGRYEDAFNKAIHYHKGFLRVERNQVIVLTGSGNGQFLLDEQAMRRDRLTSLLLTAGVIVAEGDKYTLAIEPDTICMVGKQDEDNLGVIELSRGSVTTLLSDLRYVKDEGKDLHPVSSSFNWQKYIPSKANQKWIAGGVFAVLLAALAVYCDGLNKIKQAAGY